MEKFLELLLFMMLTLFVVILSRDVKKNRQNHEELMEHLRSQTNVVQCVSCQVEEK